MAEYTRTAEICLNGHVIIDWIERYSYLDRKYCERCGQPTITTCPECKTPIIGNYNDGPFGSYQRWPYRRPNNCTNCGKPYPWVATAIMAAEELTNTLQSLSKKDKETLKALLPDLITDTPQTKVAAIKFKQLVNAMCKLSC